MLRAIISTLSVCSIALSAVQPIASAQVPPEDHRGSGRYTDHVQCPEGTKYRNSGCQPI